jgi:hypothetical protein
VSVLGKNDGCPDHPRDRERVAGIGGLLTAYNLHFMIPACSGSN